MAAKLVVVALCTKALTGCAQFEDSPGSLRGTAFGLDSQYLGAPPGGPNSRYWAAPSRDQGANRQVIDGTRWCEYVYE